MTRHTLKAVRPYASILLALSLGPGAGLLWIAQRRPAFAAADPLLFSLSSPRRIAPGGHVRVTVTLENRSDRPLRVLEPMLPTGGIHGELVTPEGVQPLPGPLDDFAAHPRPFVTLSPGSKLTRRLDLTMYVPRSVTPQGEPCFADGRYALTLRYRSRPLPGHPAPTWTGEAGPVTLTLPLVNGGYAAEELRLWRSASEQLRSDMEPKKRTSAFPARTRSLEKLLAAYPRSALLETAFQGWEQEARYLERESEITRLSRRVLDGDYDPEVKQQATTALFEAACRRRDWPSAQQWLNRLDANTRPWLEWRLKRREKPFTVTLRGDVERRAQQQKAMARAETRGRRAAQIRARQEDRQRWLRSAVMLLPPAPGEVRSGAIYSLSLPKLEQLMAARNRWLDRHPREEAAWRRKLEATAANPLLGMRARAGFEEARLDPLTADERARLRKARSGLGDSEAGYRQRIKVLAAIRSGRGG